MMEGKACGIGFIGHPNAGKSALFNALTNSEPSNRIPRYAALCYYGGMPAMPDSANPVVLADIAGIPRFSADPESNPGKMWLPLLEKAAALLFVISCPINKGGSTASFLANIEKTADYLQRVVSSYSPEMALRKRLIAVNYKDKAGNELAQRIRESQPQKAIYIVNAFSGDGLTELCNAFLNLRLAPD